MKIALLTTLPGLSENERISQEVEKMGYKFELVDLSSFNYLIDTGGLKISGLTDLKADVVIIRGILSSIKVISEVISDLAGKGMKVFDNNLLEQRYAIDKVTDLAKLALDKIPTPKTFYCRDFDGYKKAAKKVDYPMIVKSTRAGKGASVYKLGNDSQLNALLKGFIEEDKNAKSFIMQEFIDYKFDLRVLIIGDDHFTMQRIPAEGEFRANFSLGGDVKLYNLDQEGEDLAHQALSAVGMSVGGVDILIDKEGNKFVLEVNHTAGMIGMEKATGKNITKLYVEHAINCAK